MSGFFTSHNFLYGEYEPQFVLRDFLRDCKTDEEKKEAIRVYQKTSILTWVIGVGLGFLFCGIVSLF